MGSTPILVVHNAASETTTVFSRGLRGRTLTFQSGKQGAVDSLIDHETKSRWNAYGDCVAGKLKGQKLDTIVPLPSFWFAWAEFYPDTEIYRGHQE